MKRSFLHILFFTLTFTALHAENTTLPQKEIVVIIPSYNNKEWYPRNLSSALMQNYENYRIIYIDDCSSDGTGQLVRAFLQQHDTARRVTLIQNSERRGALANHWHGVHMCDDNAIIVHLDGDDWFAHKDVLARVNQEYQDNNVWLTYGQYMEYPANTRGHCRAIPEEVIAQNAWRSLRLPFPTSHLRTFYAWLFKEIKLQDLLYKGSFFSVSADVAFLFPMLEMAGSHARFIPDILYVYNNETPINDYKVRLELQLECLNYLRKQPKYTPLQQPVDMKAHKEWNNTANLIVFSYNRPMQLYAFLESVNKKVKGLSSIQVVYRADNDEYESAYQTVAAAFNRTHFIRHYSKDDFKPKTLISFTLGIRNSDYWLFAVDDLVVKDEIDIATCIDALQKTHAYGFYLRLGKNITHNYIHDIAQLTPPLEKVGNGILAWQFEACGKDWRNDWKYPNTLDMTLYHKRDIINALLALDFTSPNDLEGGWFDAPYVDYKKVGLCFEQSKVVNVQLNAVQHERSNNNKECVSVEQLLQLFNDGYKIDSNALCAQCSNASHMNAQPLFIARNCNKEKQC